MDTPRQVVAQILEYGRAGNSAEVANLMAPDGWIEWPYTPSGDPIRLQGHAQILAYLGKAAASPIRWAEFRYLIIYETTDPEVIIAEYEAHGVLTTNGEPFHQPIIAVFRVRDGAVLAYRDYLNPMILINAGVVPPSAAGD